MSTTSIKTVAVLGAGTMGQGIAQVAASAGFKTFIYDIQSDAVQRGTDNIKKSLASATSKNKITSQRANEIVSLINPTFDINDLFADLVIEAVVENLAVKQNLFKNIEAINHGSAILATNTSSLSVSAIAEILDHPENFIGIHFFNPAPLMPLVEIIPGKKTSSAITTLVQDVITSFGKTIVTSSDSPGFIVNRVARHFYLESMRAVEQNVCGIDAADALLRSAGFRMGPFELMDLIGIDINYAVTQSVYNAFDKPARFEPSRLQAQKVNEGKLGRKSGSGFYDY